MNSHGPEEIYSSYPLRFSTGKIASTTVNDTPQRTNMQADGRRDQQLALKVIQVACVHNKVGQNRIGTWTALKKINLAISRQQACIDENFDRGFNSLQLVQHPPSKKIYSVINVCPQSSMTICIHERQKYAKTNYFFCLPVVDKEDWAFNVDELLNNVNGDN